MHLLKYAALLLALLLYGQTGAAVPRIAVLDFELNDITSLPNTAQEQQRTSSFRFLLETQLGQYGQYQLVSISSTEQARANAGFGYLFRFDDIAARLAGTVGADWVVVAQHSKPSFLFSYLMVHLVDVKNPARTARFDIELKGNHQKVSERGVKALAEKIHSYLQANGLS
jgi:hypothetical protein